MCYSIHKVSIMKIAADKSSTTANGLYQFYLEQYRTLIRPKQGLKPLLALSYKKNTFNAKITAGELKVGIDIPLETVLILGRM